MTMRAQPPRTTFMSRPLKADKKADDNDGCPENDGTILDEICHACAAV